MEQNYVFMTDSDSDLPFHLKEQYDIPVVYMPYALDGKEYFDDLGQMLDHKSYYDMMRNGATPVTSALNEATYLDYFEPVLKEKDLLFVAFSSKLSCTLQAVYSAREKLLKKYPERKFTVVDTLRISGPMTLLVLKAHEMYRAGKPMDEVASWLEANRLRAQAYFIVDDLKYLKRGGRISATAATVGTMLDLKPIIMEAADGTLTSNDKIRGRKKAIAFIVDKMLEFAPDPAESPVFVLNADSHDDAERVKAMVEQKLPGANVLIENVGPVIGAHAGPGTLALCFIGTKPLA
jgi:DegV family protein with EDD domain